ncbi:MAG: phosphoglycerate kinase [Planctomycetota bacterium]|jgi:phosphoglycerate kinase
MAKQTIDRIDVAGQRVLMRVDFNVPLDGGRITDDRRIRMALPSIRSVLDRQGSLVLMSHCGRPSGAGYEAEYSLEPAARRLGELLGADVGFPSHDCIDDAAASAVSALGGGDVLLLENLRFHAGEKKGDAAFAARLAAYGEIYCNDAFGTAHRPHASMLGVPEAMVGRPRVAGLLMQKELRYLGDLLRDPPRPFAAILGGAKVSDKLGAIRNLQERVDLIQVGGAMAYTFLSAQGHAIGASRVESAMLDEARTILADTGGAALMLPLDHVCGRALEAGTPVRVCDGGIEDGWMGLDIGPRSREAFAAALSDVKAVVWNGPLGVFETPPFDAGTRAIADALVAATERGATTVVGGGDTAAAVEAFGLADRVSHVSTGGGASLEMLEGRAFESVEVLDEAG